MRTKQYLLIILIYTDIFAPTTSKQIICFHNPTTSTSGYNGKRRCKCKNSTKHIIYLIGIDFLGIFVE